MSDFGIYLYHTVGWTSLQSRRNSHLVLIIYKALLLKFPNYLLTSLLSFKSTNYLTFHIPHVRTNVGRTSLLYFTLFVYSQGQCTLSNITVSVSVLAKGLRGRLKSAATGLGLGSWRRFTSHPKSFFSSDWMVGEPRNLTSVGSLTGI